MFGSGGPSDDGHDDGTPPLPPFGSESGGGSATDTGGMTTGGMEDPTDGNSTDQDATDEGSTDAASTEEGSTTAAESETGELEEATTGEASACDQPPGAMSPAMIPTAEVGVPYQVTFSGPDGVYLYDWFTLVGAPPGLVLTSDSQPDTEATLSGTPTSAGSHDFIMIANPTGEGCVNADALIVEYTLDVDA